jgi:hypothetical protein
VAGKIEDRLDETFLFRPDFAPGKEAVLVIVRLGDAVNLLGRASAYKL